MTCLGGHRQPVACSVPCQRENSVVSIEEFRDTDADYLAWVEAHRAGYVVNIARHERGDARLHRATCQTITSRPPFTGPYIKGLLRHNRRAE